MSSKWVFSPSSALYLQRCIDAAPQPDLNNKWFQKFGKKDSLEECNFSIQEKTVNFENTSPKMAKDETITYENFFDFIESEPTIPVEFVMQVCSKNPALITKMAEKLPTNTVEQLFKHIFSMKDIEAKRLTAFITIFLQTLIKVQFSRLCIDILVTLTEEYQQVFKELLEILINDTEIPSQVLKNYIAALNEETVTNFMNILSSVEISSEGFAQNVLVIYTAYKDCIKNDQYQNYIQKLIIQHSKLCASDRNFGRLFLTFLQSEKALGRKVNVQMLEECLEVHRSPFKRPCSMLLKEI